MYSDEEHESPDDDDYVPHASDDDDDDSDNENYSSVIPESDRSVPKRVPWSKIELLVLKREFEEEIKQETIPKSRKIQTVQKKFACLQKRSLAKIKARVQYMIKVSRKKKREVSLSYQD